MPAQPSPTGPVAAIFRPAPLPSRHLNVSLLGERASMPIRFYFWRDVLLELRRAAAANPNLHSLCALTGSYGLATDGPFMEVDGFQDFLSFDPDETSEGALHDHLFNTFCEEMLPHKREVNAGSGPLGLFYHAPRSEALLDERIVRLHLSLCNIPYQLILSSDLLAQSHQLALYTRRTHEALQNTSFYVLSQRERDEEE